jgi:ArsR family transcriptional regulator
MSSYSYDIDATLNGDTCEIEYVDQEKVDSVRGKLKGQETLFDLAELFKALGDSTRIRILHTLSHGDELCVCDLAALIGMSQSAVSHQLRLLRIARLVKHRKSGKMVYYSLDDEHVKKLVELGLDHVEERH